VANDINTYLRELQAALAAAGADPALVQDALFDAEEHLQAEMAAGGALGRGTAAYEKKFATVAEGYGTPEEVAAAYMGTAVVRKEAPAAHETPSVTEAPPVWAPSVGAAAPLGATSATPQPPGGTQPPVAPLPVAEGPAPHMAGWPPPAPGVPMPAGVQAGIAAAAGAAPTSSPWRQVFGVFADVTVWKTLIYMILSLATGIAYFTIVVTGLSTAGSMLVLIIGIPMFLAVLGIVRAIALFEGRLVEILLGIRMPRRPRATPPGMGFFQRIAFWLKDGRTWASMAYMLLMLPLGITYFTIAVTGLSVGFWLVASIVWGWFRWADYHTIIYNGVTYYWWHSWMIPIAVIVGVIVLVGMFHLIKWIGRGHAAFAKAMLVRLAK